MLQLDHVLSHQNNKIPNWNVKYRELSQLSVAGLEHANFGR